MAALVFTPCPAQSQPLVLGVASNDAITAQLKDLRDRQSALEVASPAEARIGRLRVRSSHRGAA